MTLPLEGIRILDTAHQYPGPYCTMLLADLGADVLKVERPGSGDPARQLPDFFNSINRNKKSLSLNLKLPEARRIFHQLSAQSDVVIEGFRPGVAERLAIDYETLKKDNPRLIYCSISGYGQDGPYRDVTGHDLNYLAMAGMLQGFKSETGKTITPTLAVGDLSSGMFAAIGILAALSLRDKTGMGQNIDVSMFDGLISWMGAQIGTHHGEAAIADSLDAGYGTFYGSDDLGFTLGIAYEDWFWASLCSVAGLDEIKDLDMLDRRAKRGELQEILQTVFSMRTRAEWIAELTAADVPVAPVQTIDDIVKDPHVAHRKMIEQINMPSGGKSIQTGFPIKFNQTTLEIRTPPPELGENTVEVLTTLGFSTAEIAQFKNDGII